MMNENTNEHTPQFESNTQLEASNGREYHMRLDSMTGMRQKEVLFLSEGIEYLGNKFGESTTLYLGDVAGMGIGNEMLHRPNEDELAAHDNVDICFTLMNEVANDVFGEDLTNRPFEIIRMGGDEIVYLLQKGDPRFDDFMAQYTQAREKFLIEEAVGEEVYENTKHEMNIKAQMKLLTKEPDFELAASTGNIADINEWLHTQLENEFPDENRTSDLMRLAAEKRLLLIPEEDRLSPLDMYISRGEEIQLTGDTQEIKEDMMFGIAQADADIAWAKGHPGVSIDGIEEPHTNEVQEVADKYLEQSNEIEATIALIKEKERHLIESREDGDELEIARLTHEIIRLETNDPGTGAIRFDRAQERPLSDLIEMGESNSTLQMHRLDVPYFGVFNNHYDYASADEMMRKIGDTYRKHTGGVLIRDGGNFVSVVSGETEPLDKETLYSEVTTIIEEYAHPDNINKRQAMENEVAVKQAITRSWDTFGTVKLYETTKVEVTKDTVMGDVVGAVLV